jgi:hypothetical protein
LGVITSAERSPGGIASTTRRASARHWRTCCRGSSAQSVRSCAWPPICPLYARRHDEQRSRRKRSGGTRGFAGLRPVTERFLDSSIALGDIRKSPVTRKMIDGVAFVPVALSFLPLIVFLICHHSKNNRAEGSVNNSSSRTEQVPGAISAPKRWCGHRPTVIRFSYGLQMTRSTRRCTRSSISISLTTSRRSPVLPACPMSWWSIPLYRPPGRFRGSSPTPRPIRANSTWRRPAAGQRRMCSANYSS